MHEFEWLRAHTAGMPHRSIRKTGLPELTRKLDNYKSLEQRSFKIWECSTKKSDFIANWHIDKGSALIIRCTIHIQSRVTWKTYLRINTGLFTQETGRIHIGSIDNSDEETKGALHLNTAFCTVPYLTSTQAGITKVEQSTNRQQMKRTSWLKFWLHFHKLASILQEFGLTGTWTDTNVKTKIIG